MSDPREGVSRDPHIAEAGGRAANTGPDTIPGSATASSQTSRRESMHGRLMELAVWLSEHPKEARKNLKAIRRGNPIDPGVYYNSGLRMIERLYRPQHVALGNKMLRISTDPAAPVEEIRRKVLEGKR
ncbi:hypothetical protein [Rubrobacter aplysinae]|uniref:hypothetical protein n=1 Tax=Rubrobacter aplysinae TaxID=909625 RepID=UPI00128E00C6|nr:hypothetical protein [Rubrobacter aplysinae]